MKKLILGLLSLFVFVSLQAQDAGAAYKAANKAMKRYPIETDNQKKAELLSKAIMDIDVAVAAQDEFEGKDKTKMLLKAGEIYNEQANSDLKQQITNESFKSDHPDAALRAYKALTKVLEIADKKYFKNDAMDALKITADHLGNAGLFAYKAGEYDLAYNAYSAVGSVKDILDKAGKKGVLEVEGAVNDNNYMKGLSALQAGKKNEAIDIFTALTENGYEESGVYNSLFKLNLDENPAKAEEFLAKGRKKFPEDQGLMVTELNHYLATNRFDELVGKLEAAIQADPENVSYYSALGNTYDNLFQKEMKEAKLSGANRVFKEGPKGGCYYVASSGAKVYVDKKCCSGGSCNEYTGANDYFAKALEYYTRAIELDPTYFFAIYNSGVLYVNKANLLIEELKVMEDAGKYDKASLRAMEAKKGEISAEFDKALPFFQKAESMDANDINTLNALKEIYARAEEFDKSKEFSARLKKVQDGGKNDSSYHKK